MEFTLNNFQYKYQEERILKLSKSGKYCRWLHKNITNSKDYTYFDSNGTNMDWTERNMIMPCL